MSEADFKEWILLANHDADTADLLIKQRGHADVIIYHIHQAVEKLLKALLIKAGGTFEKTHFLDKLLAKTIEFYPELSKHEESILAINLYLPKLRYPYGDVIEFKEAEDTYKKFTDIKQAVLKLLGK
ncbi:MAG: HEPN domain-containing protein [Candidatus Margulisiibacteriota bacterium]